LSFDEFIAYLLLLIGVFEDVSL